MCIYIYIRWLENFRGEDTKIRINHRWILINDRPHFPTLFLQQDSADPARLGRESF